jgi:RimJ/RimL family protein N-acetyltransferase
MTETTYKSLVKNSFSCTDGQGIKRVFQQVMDVIKSTNSMTLQLADKNDVDIIFQWQSNADIRRFSRNSTPIEYQEHCQWFEQAIKSKNRKIYLMSYQQRFVGMLRLDDIDSNSCEISILVAPKEQGKGLALKALNSLTALNIKQEIHAYVHTDNLTSHKLFQKAKFSKIDPNNYCLYPNKSR